MYISHFVCQPIYEHLITTYFHFNFLKIPFCSEESRWLGTCQPGACCVVTCALSCFIQFTKTLVSCLSSVFWSLYQLVYFDGQEQKTLAELGCVWSYISSHSGQTGLGSPFLGLSCLAVPRAGFSQYAGSWISLILKCTSSLHIYYLWWVSSYILWCDYNLIGRIFPFWVHRK